MKILLLCLLVTTPALAANQKLNLKPPAAKAENGTAADLIYQTNVPKTGGTGGAAISATCTDSMGFVHKQGATGFEGCLRTQDKTRPETGAASRKNSVGISFGK